VRLSPRLLALEIAAFVAFGLIAAAGFLAWRLSQGPIDLEFIRPQIERSLTDARDGRPVSVESLVLEWSREHNRLEAAARGVVSKDKSGAVEFEAARAAISLDAGALLGGKFRTRRVRLEDGQATVERSADGVWTLANIVLMREPASAKPFDPLRDLNWATLATPIRAGISAGSFERVEISRFMMKVKDRKVGADWTASPVNGLWIANADGVSLDLQLKLAGGEPNQVRIKLAADGAVTRAAGTLEMDGVDPQVLVRTAGLGDAFAFDKSATAAITAEATEAGGLQGTALRLSGVAGRFKVGSGEVVVEDLGLEAAYDPLNRQVELRSLDIRSDHVSGRFAGRFDVSQTLLAGEARPTPFELRAENATVDLRPMFENPWPLAAGEARGVISGDGLRMTIESLKALTGDMTIDASGEVWLDGQPGARRVGAKVSAVGGGVITPQQVTDFWPVKLGAVARQWVKDNILTGRTSRAVFTADLPPGAVDAGALADEALSLEFDIADATVEYLDGFPPVTGVAGRGRLRGNSLEISIADGRLKGWRVEEGSLTLPRFYPHGETMRIAVSGSGDLRSMMQALDESPLQVGRAYGLNIAGMEGVGGADVEVLRPIGEKVTDADVKYTISGGFRDAAAPDLVGEHGLTRSNVRVQVTEKGLTISGAGRFGAAPAVFEWTETAGQTFGSKLTASAKVNADFLNAFGLAARTFMQGEADLTVNASGRGRDFQTLEADLDLTHAAIELAEFGWRKPYDSPAKGTIRFGRDDDGEGIVTADIRGDGLQLAGDARLSSAGPLAAARIERIYARDSIDLRGSVNRRPDGGYTVALTGPLFDARPWMDALLDFSPPVDPHGEAIPRARAAGPALSISLATDRLRLRDDAELASVQLSAMIDEAGPRQMDLQGAVTADKAVQVALRPDGADRKLTVRSDDAGFAARVFLKTDYFTGGRLSLDGVFGPSQGQAQLTMSDVRIREAPLLAQILSVASLRGLTDVLSGEGVLFTRVDAPLKVAGGRIEFPGVKASGPAMGLTARGWFAPESGEISLDGVLVPSFGVNSALGGLPIIGDLFVSRQGEGLFAPIYSVRGTLSRAQVSINPLAAVTPGVLRRIFENPAETPSAEDVAKN
jgi:hypothetical protein